MPHDDEEPPPRKALKPAEVAQSKKRPVGRPRRHRPIFVNLVDDGIQDSIMTVASNQDSSLVDEGASSTSTSSTTPSQAVTLTRNACSSKYQFT